VAPSAELATVAQFVTGAVVCAQFNPALVETKMGPSAKPLAALTATRIVPSADEATELNGWSGGLCWVQVLPASVEV